MTKSNQHLGGNDFDKVIVEVMKDEIQKLFELTDDEITKFMTEIIKNPFYVYQLKFNNCFHNDKLLNNDDVTFEKEYI